MKIKVLKILCFIFMVLGFIAYDFFVIEMPFKSYRLLLAQKFYVNYFTSLFALICWLSIVLGLYVRSRYLGFLALLFTVVPLGLQTVHYRFFHGPIDAFAIKGFFDGPGQFFEMGLANINFLLVFVFLLFCTILTIAVHLYYKLDQTKLRRYVSKFTFKTKILTSFIIFVPLMWFCGTHWYFLFKQQTSFIAAYAALPETLMSIHKTIQHPHIEAVVLSETTKKMPNILWIIGEAANKNHMSLYGYERQTTPFLDQLQESGELFAYQNAISIGAHTAVSVPYMLKGLQRIDPDGKILSAPSIFEYAKSRGYQTLFMSAQYFTWRNINQYVGINKKIDILEDGTRYGKVTIFKGIDDLQFLNGSIQPALNSLQAPFLFVVQMDGSHFPFASHSAQEYKKFLPEKNENDINAYDNTIYYSDRYFEKFITQIRQKYPETWIFYTSDHGQILSSNRQSTKIIKVSDLQKNQNIETDIAMFIIPPHNMKKLVRINQSSPVAQSDIFATILDLMV